MCIYLYVCVNTQTFFLVVHVYHVYVSKYAFKYLHVHIYVYNSCAITIYVAYVLIY